MTMGSRGRLSLLSLVLIRFLTIASAGKCTCKYESAGEIPSAAAADAGDKTYGTSCNKKWDSLPGTKYFKNSAECNSTNTCQKGCNFMHLEWCYIDRDDPDCADVVSYPTTLAGVTNLNLSYSYDICDNPYCWNDFNAWDAECPGGEGCKDCKCEFESAGKIPSDAAAAAGNETYGTSCTTAWDSVAGTTYYKNDTVCPASKKCDKGCNYLNLEWCYVSRYCRGRDHYPTTLKGTTAKLAYSYDMCNNPYCWNDFNAWDAECPGGLGCKACKCEFESAGKIPSDAAAAAGNEKYGTSCSTAWDGVAGTKYYKDDTVCPESKQCQKGCNYINLEWCYVNRFCRDKEHYPTTLAGTTAKLAYSYDMCNNPYCWNDFGAWNEGCPGTTACSMVDAATLKGMFAVGLSAIVGLGAGYLF